jgi:hypothetical protein
MSFKIRKLTQIDLVADERLYLSADGKRVLREGEPGAATLLAAAGQIIPANVVKRLGLKAPDEVTPAPAEVKQ